MNKVWNMFGMDTQNEREDEDYENIDEEYNDEEEMEDRHLFGRRNSKIVSLPQPQQIKMVMQ